MPELEKRIKSQAVELRETDPAISPGTLVGYAAVFNSWSEPLGFFREKIQPGAFTRSLNSSASDVRALVDHNTGRVIGRTTAGTLRLSENDTGLQVEIDLRNTTDGRDLAESVSRGDIDGMSFGFTVDQDSWAYLEADDKLDERTLEQISVFEFSAVTFPAYPDTSLAKRSWEEAKPEKSLTRVNLHRQRWKLLNIKP